MTTVLISASFKFKINERDHQPPHVHVERKGLKIRINLITLEMMDKRTEFSVNDVARIIEVVRLQQYVLLTEWTARHG